MTYTPVTSPYLQVINMTKSKETRIEIIEAAERIFSRSGREDVSLNDVATESHRCLRTLYNYFLNINELYLATIEYELAKMLTTLTKIASQEMPADVKLEQFVIAHFRSVREATEHDHSLRKAFYTNHEEIDRARRPVDYKEIRLLKDILNQGKIEGIFDIHDANWTAMLILYAMKGIEPPYLKQSIGTYLETHKDNIIDMILKGLVKR